MSTEITIEVWREMHEAIPDGFRFSSLHTNVAEVPEWSASVWRLAKPPCECCGKGYDNGEFITGHGPTPDAAMRDLIAAFRGANR